ncbi:hypothetical protein DSL72_004695 [Monilinia vaccinii-corymbosi]|uniref:Metallo-beta-lactamase domain-containing protein n=1 Tax=Monilinia vaccinii-corymbosi TaxID=61207 RepID=A0A8A3NWX9_9HELO|nr:hypothetical protein DSL72_004695 [Monilinia vaccinii-corymbosi]
MSNITTSNTTSLYKTHISNPSTNPSSTPESSRAKPHHLKDGKGFTNPWDSWVEKSAPGVVLSMMKAKLTGNLPTPDTTPPTVPVQTPTFLPMRHSSSPSPSPSPSALRATWLGHACYYLEYATGLRVLFDPVFEERCSPLPFFGPKRYTAAPCAIADLPFVDLVIISHSHYDHLSQPTITEIHARHPRAHFLVGLGLKRWFRECGIENVVEMDWWQDVHVTLSPEVEGSEGAKTPASPPITARISCLPSQHSSGRSALDRSQTLWCSWSVQSGGKSVWFGGDTGYRAVPAVPKGTDDYGEAFAHLPVCPAFREIGEWRGPFDLGLIPIGAYEPRPLFSPLHSSPPDSVNIFLDTRCRRAMAIHWGTWVLTSEAVLEPPRLLRRALASKGLPETGVFDVCEIGEGREF